MTEGELSILVAERDEDSKRFVSRVHRLKGMPVFITTLTGAEIDPQLLSRVSTIEIDQSESQTKRIVEKKLEQWSTVAKEPEYKILGPISSIDEKCRQLGPYVEAVKIPFAEKLKNDIPPLLSMRRWIDRILSLTANVAFLKATLDLRPLAELKRSPGTRGIHILALPEDLEDAKYCLGENLLESISYFYGRAKEVYDYLLSCGGEASVKDVAHAIKLGYNRAGEYLRSLLNLGYATRSGRRGDYQYTAIPRESYSMVLKAQLTRKDLEEWFNHTYPADSAKLVVPPGADTGFTISQTGSTVMRSSEHDLITIGKTMIEMTTIPSTVIKTSPDAIITGPTEYVLTSDDSDRERVLAKLRSVKDPMSWDYALCQAMKATGDRTKAEGYLKRFQADGRFVQDPDGYFRLER